MQISAPRGKDGLWMRKYATETFPAANELAHCSPTNIVCNVLAEED